MPPPATFHYVHIIWIKLRVLPPRVTVGLLLNHAPPTEDGWNFSQKGEADSVSLGQWDAKLRRSSEISQDYSSLILEDAEPAAMGSPTTSRTNTATAELLHQRVEVTGLIANTDKNGARGTAFEYVSESDSYNLRLDDGSEVLVKRDNLVKVQVLTLTGHTGQRANLMGAYERSTDTVNGFPLYAKRLEDGSKHWLYRTKAGRWVVAPNESSIAKNSASIRASSQGGGLPSEAGLTWDILAGSKWHKDPNITCTEVRIRAHPPSSKSAYLRHRPGWQTLLFIIWRSAVRLAPIRLPFGPVHPAHIAVTIQPIREATLSDSPIHASVSTPHHPQTTNPPNLSVETFSAGGTWYSHDGRLSQGLLCTG